MRKIQWIAALWAIVLALPFTVLAIGGIAFLDEHLHEITNLNQLFNQLTTVGGGGWIFEISKRLPELAGMVIGQLVILTILFFARSSRNNSAY